MRVEYQSKGFWVAKEWACKLAASRSIEFDFRHFEYITDTGINIGMRNYLTLFCRK